MKLIFNQDIYTEVILKRIANAKQRVWISTANIKDLYVAKGTKMVPFLEILSDLVKRKVEIRLIFAKEPGPAFQKEFDRYPNLIHGVEQMQCIRVHYKMVVVDGEFAYTGSANLTGAGMGAKGENTRNFESGIIGTEPTFVDAITKELDLLWIGNFCSKCRRKEYCGEWKGLS